MATKRQCPDDGSWELVHVVPAWGPEHDLHGMNCWCHPVPDELSMSTIIHHPPEEASH